MQIDHPFGAIVIRQIEEDDILAAAVLLSRSFARRERFSLEDVTCVVFI